MKALSIVVERLAWVSVLIGGIGLLISMILGVADVIGSYFNHPVAGAYEFTESTMVLVVFGGLTYAQIKRKHIRVELLYTHVRPRLQSTMDIIAGLAAITFILLLLWQGINEAQYSLEIDEATSGLIRFPLYPARFALVFGASLFCLQLILDLVEDIQRLAQNRGGREEDLMPVDADNL
ncbi:TRAP transporter small permease [Bradyrhizobium sp. LHD-71]|uniref:TRAP transporter small permease subunit n=1 Tax=Bradyrhizobium sp. LHD-71 TaxID=3072141 RepID=UPI00280E45C2|nr:TRAP transporter small permease [Bradyrhizobium sp. LHD-71]MDQ8729289.1 TRAP transporter small permease [Bradyrhizobium sp. LHD-71]